MHYLLLLLAFTFASSAAEKTSCNLFGGRIIPPNREASLTLTVFQLPDRTSTIPVVTGRYRLWDNEKMLTEGAINYSPGMGEMNIPIGRPTQGFHLYRAEYFDPEGRFAWCLSDWLPVYVGNEPSGPLVFSFPAKREITFREHQGLLAIINPFDTQAWLGISFYLEDVENPSINLSSSIDSGTSLFIMPEREGEQTRQLTRTMALTLRRNILRETILSIPNRFVATLLPKTGLSVSTVNRLGNFGDLSQFELQASFNIAKRSRSPLRGRLEWYDGDRKIGEQMLLNPSSIEPFFLNRVAETPGLHFYRARYVPSTGYIPPQFNFFWDDSFTWLPPGESEPFRVEVTAPTEVRLSTETLGPGARLRAELTSRGRSLSTGQIAFSVNGAAAGVATVQAGAAVLDLPTVAIGSYTIEARFSGGVGYTGSRAEARLEIRNAVSVRQAASGGNEIAPASLASVFGANLAGAAASSTTSELPSMISGVSVTIEDSQNRSFPARLSFVSPNQINLLIPDGLAVGLGTLTVRRNGQIAGQGNIDIRLAAPGLFTMDGNRLPAGLVSWRTKDGRTFTRTVFDCANTCRGEAIPLGLDAEEAVLTLFGTGWRGSREGISARLGGETARVLFAGAHSSFPGLDQLNIQLDVSRKGRLLVEPIADGKRMNPVEVLIE